jgi:predicted DNA-binding transcriptional regulator YafY
MDRLAPHIPTGPRFTPRETPHIDLAAYLSRGVSTTVYRYQARITLHVPAETAAEQILPSIGVIEAIDPRTCLLHTGSNSLDELATYLGLFDLPFTVHEPPELRSRIRDLAARLTNAVH